MSASSNKVGVIVARFHVPKLHPGHRFLVETVRKNHDEVCIVLGTTKAMFNKSNPLSTNVRRAMIQNAFPDVVMSELKDMRSDEAWSSALDALIEKIFPGKDAVLYGSRGSFIPHYSGRFPTHEVKEIHLESGAQARYAAAAEVRDSEDFRAGMIHAAYERYSLVFPTVDIAIVNPSKRVLLLGRRKSDGGKWRFFGGFVDPTDESILAAAKREAAEEVASNMSLEDFTFLGSTKIDDFRYRGTGDAIMTSFFKATYCFGPMEPADDIEEAAWFSYDTYGEHLVDTHYPLAAIFNQMVRDAN